MSSALLLAPPFMHLPRFRRQKVIATWTSISVPIALNVRPTKFNKPMRYLEGAPETARSVGGILFGVEPTFLELIIKRLLVFGHCCFYNLCI
jgi:hypothetical protein